MICRQVHVPIGLLLVFGITLTAGCHGVEISQAQVAPESGWSVKKYGRGRILIGPEISILVRASNSTDERKANELGISLWFDPKRPDLKISPDGVILLLPSSPELKPARINIEWAGANQGMWECGNYPKIDFGPGPLYLLRRGFCVELYFDIKPPSPDTPFAMRITGLMRDGERLAVPDIHFVKGSVTVIDLPLFP